MVKFSCYYGNGGANRHGAADRWQLGVELIDQLRQDFLANSETQKKGSIPFGSIVFCSSTNTEILKNETSRILVWQQWQQSSRITTKKIQIT